MAKVQIKSEKLTHFVFFPLSSHTSKTSDWRFCSVSIRPSAVIFVVGSIVGLVLFIIFFEGLCCLEQ